MVLLSLVLSEESLEMLSVCGMSESAGRECAGLRPSPQVTVLCGQMERVWASTQELRTGALLTKTF